MNIKTGTGISCQKLTELLETELRHRTLENLVANADKPDAMKRRIFDIMHGKSQVVSLRVADEIAITCGRPDWLQFV